jgi:type II secretory pathway pseudopilin PulG
MPTNTGLDSFDKAYHPNTDLNPLTANLEPNQLTASENAKGQLVGTYYPALRSLATQVIDTSTIPTSGMRLYPNNFDPTIQTTPNGQPAAPIAPPWPYDPSPNFGFAQTTTTGWSAITSIASGPGTEGMSYSNPQINNQITLRYIL